jgi:acyl-CoA ligase (AMP-forming) (exosortase A-associated)
MNGTPESLPKPLDHLIGRGEPADIALILRDKTISYAQLGERVSLLAAWLVHSVGEKGARIASWAAKGELTCLLPLAVARAGMVHVPINPLLKRAQAAYILADSSASMMIGTPARLKTLEDGDVLADCAVFEEAEALNAALEFSGHLPASAYDPEELAAILYTSGSTGQPKGVMLSHANMWLGAVSVAQYLGMSSDDVTLAVLPFSFDYGQSQLLCSWYAGAAVAPLDYLFPRDVVKACAKYGVTTLAAVPPLWVQLMEVEWSEDAIRPMRRLTNSGGALSRELVGDLRRTFPNARLFPMYGLTEAFRSTYLDPNLVDSHPTSMGKAIPFAEILVINDAGDVAGPGEEGELVHCGPLVARGYWQDEERTTRRFKPAPEASHYGGIAVWSGDRVTRNEDGLLYFVGRRDAMIKSQGNRISPQEIEDAAMASGMVVEAVALGVPDVRQGQSVQLVVRAEPGNSTAQDELPKYLARELPNFMQPQSIHWRDQMPLNPNGKVDRNRLLEEITE